MKIDRFINSVLFFLFRADKSGEARAYFHSQNLNEDRRGDVKGWPYEGRCWVRGFGFNSRFSWNLWTHFCGFSFSYSWEEGFCWHISFPPIAFWFSLGGFRKFREWWSSRPWLKVWNEKYGGYPDSHKYTDFTFFSFSIFNWALHWDIFKFEWGWSHLMPKWMDGHFNIPDFLLGSQKYKKETLSTHQVIIPMPEGGYPATIELERCTWTRPRWPFATRGFYADVKISQGIPHEGKGENSWDCGEDRLYGGSYQAGNLSEAIGAVVKSALRNREKYNGGGVKAAYPPPTQVPVTPAEA
jgi:hypothetical protein